MSVVTASGSSGGGSTINPGAGSGRFPADCEYFTDPAFEDAWDRSTEPLDMINEILDMTGQTAADEMVNLGAYRALIDTSLIEKGGETGGSSSGQSSGAPQEFEDWTVRSTREDKTSPMYVRVGAERGGVLQRPDLRPRPDRRGAERRQPLRPLRGQLRHEGDPEWPGHVQGRAQD